MPSDNNHDFVILGGGVAGLTFALEASRRGQRALLLESEDQVGSLAGTLRFGDFRFDIGGHRFHSRWPEITRWMLAVLDGDAREVRRFTRTASLGFTEIMGGVSDSGSTPACAETCRARPGRWC